MLQVDNHMEVSVNFRTDEDGYLDRECPNEQCKSSFKIFLDDWKDKFRDKEMFCPICGHTAPSDKWFTEAQVEHIKTALFAEIRPVLDAEMRRITQDFNRRQSRGGFIRISMGYKPSAPVAVVPIEALDLMQQRYTCEACGCRYAAIGAAFFCPACGHNSARTSFAETLVTIRKLPEICAVLESNLDRDAVANVRRLLIEENMGKVVTAFQHFAEAMFDTLPNTNGCQPRQNLFQNLMHSSDLWETVIGVRYESMVERHEWTELLRYFQQRHLLVHKDGVVDADYLAKTKDPNYQLGQRLVLRIEDILRFTDLVEKLAKALEQVCTLKKERKDA